MNSIRHSGESRNPVSKPFLKNLFKTWTPAFAGVTVLLFVVAAVADEANDAVLKQGKESYEQYCLRCHGADGKGDGPDAKRVPVTPRNFTRGVYKFRTTASGTPPSDKDLIYTLDHGMSGAGMPSFANLSLNVKKSLIAYIKTFAPDFGTYPPQPLAEPNTKARVDLARGKEIYTKLQCALCHGEAGRANGTSAPTLTDQWGAPIKPANLYQEWTYRAGSSARDIYFRLMAGISGTPMPSYDGAITSDEAWQLANYVVSLQHHANWSYNVIAQKTSQTLPTDPKDSAWKNVPRTDVNLQSSYYANGRRHAGAIKAVGVQTLVNGNEAAIRLAWADPTQDTKTPDEMIVAFLPSTANGDDRPHLANVSLNGTTPFDVMVWSAADPNVVRQKGTQGKAFKANAVFTDGLWELVFVRPIEGQAKSFPVAFGAMDGGSGESGLSRSVSQWIPFMLASSGHAGH